jgi:transcriptional regulator with XRE-family HTH domain
MQSAGPGLMAKKRAMPPAPEPRKAIHEKLRALVDARKGGRSDAEVAAAAGMSRQYFSNLMLGRIKDPRYSTVMAVLDAVGATLSDFDRA